MMNLMNNFWTRWKCEVWQCEEFFFFHECLSVSHLRSVCIQLNQTKFKTNTSHHLFHSFWFLLNISILAADMDKVWSCPDTRMPVWYTQARGWLPDIDSWHHRLVIKAICLLFLLLLLSDSIATVLSSHDFFCNLFNPLVMRVSSFLSFSFQFLLSSTPEMLF